MSVSDEPKARLVSAVSARFATIVSQRRRGRSGQEARAVDHRRLAVEDRLRRATASCAGSSSRSASWMATTVPRARANPSRMACPFPRLRSAWMTVTRRRRRERVERRTRAVGRAVVDDDDFAWGGKVDFEQPGDDRRDGDCLVVDGDDDRDERRSGVARAGQSGGCLASFASRPSDRQRPSRCASEAQSSPCRNRRRRPTSRSGLRRPTNRRRTVRRRRSELSWSGHPGDDRAESAETALVEGVQVAPPSEVMAALSTAAVSLR